MRRQHFIAALAILTSLSFHGTSAEEGASADPEEERGECAQELNEATDLLVDGKLEESEEALRALRSKEITKTTWAMASFNLGINLKMQEKYQESIEVFKEILSSDVNDRDPAPNLMEHFRNYRHKACWEISYNYELMKDYEKALEYIDLAKTKYTFQDICGTCLREAHESIERRTKHLKELIEKRSNNALHPTPYSHRFLASCLRTLRATVRLPGVGELGVRRDVI